MIDTVPSALISAAGAGDRDALVQLLTLAQPDIRRFARRTCRLSSDVDDAVQETLWLLTRRIGALRSIDSFSAWLFTVVRRECLRLARSLGIAETIDGHAERLLAERPDSELRLDLADALQSLPDHYRAVILLRDVEGMSIGEIADTFDLTREAVKGRLHRARALLREYLLR